MRDVHHRVTAAFKRHFSGAPTHVTHAPGRVNLIGEHTDYNEGWVLPCALDYGVVIAARPRADAEIHVIALDYGETRATFQAALPLTLSEPASISWLDYIKGVLYVFLKSGHSITGADIVLGGDVPQGAGLSSSAALQVALGWSLSEINELGLSRATIARYAQRAENEFVGCQCGIMDQLASALGEPERAMLIDCRSLSVELIPLPSSLELVIVNSNVRRGLVESAYNDRRAECAEAARALGHVTLRDATLAELNDARSKLSNTAYRRARHVITENERVLSATRALKKGDLTTLAQLMRASHHSLRDDFEVTVPAVNTLVTLIEERIGTGGGARMTGGGFGGCVVALHESPLPPNLYTEIATAYRAQTGLDTTFYKSSTGLGVSSAF